LNSQYAGYGTSSHPPPQHATCYLNIDRHVAAKCLATKGEGKCENGISKLNSSPRKTSCGLKCLPHACSNDLGFIPVHARFPLQM